MDLVYDAILVRQRVDPAPVRWRDVAGPLMANGIPEEQLREAASEWLGWGSW